MSSKALHRWWKWLSWGLVIAALLYVFTNFPVGEWLRSELTRIQDLGFLGYVWFMVIYIVLTVLWFPASLLTLGAGAVFGVLRGSLLVSVSATLGATAAFLLGRYAARSAIARRLEGNARFEAVDRAVGERGFRIVLLTRLSPVFPFVLLNYAFGVTRVGLRDYVLASFIGMLPGTVLYVYLGSLAAMTATGTLPDSLGRQVFTIIGLIVTIVVTLYVTRVARKALRDVERTSHDPS